jgi:hypothetical protein
VAAVLGLKGRSGLEQRDLRNLNLGDLKKGPNGGLSPPPKSMAVVENMMPYYIKVSTSQQTITAKAAATKTIIFKHTTETTDK